MNRDEYLKRLRTRSAPWDLLIIGGGATGLGAALDAASRGHETVLIESHDFAQATSSRSTKLIHGGGRYLKQGNLSLVFEALRERALLLRNAPHLTRIIDLVIPCYHWSDLPFYGAGLQLYDALAGNAGLARSRWLSAEAVRERLPNAATAGLKSGIVYQDGQFDDSALALAIARTAARHGATLLNYLPCLRLIKRSGRVLGVIARDEESGEEFELHARVVLNATGVFADTIRHQDEPGSAAMVRPSQGAHLVLRPDFFPGETAMLLPKTSDGRVIFAVPWHGRVLWGTTDTPVREISREPRALPEEIDFLLSHAARYLNNPPSRKDIVSVFAGLRPLVSRKSAAGTASLARDHVIEVSASGLITITGGKWTTWRHMAEEVISQGVEAILPRRACLTKSLPLDDDFGGAIEALSASEPGLAAPLHPGLPDRGVDVVWHVRETMARSVEDVLIRRTRAAILDARASLELAGPVSRILAWELGWDESRREAEERRYAASAASYLPFGE